MRESAAVSGPTPPPPPPPPFFFFFPLEVTGAGAGSVLRPGKFHGLHNSNLTKCLQVVSPGMVTTGGGRTKVSILKFVMLGMKVPEEGA